MFTLRRPTAVLVFLVATLPVTRSEAQRVDPPWADPQAMFEMIFGAEDEVDENVLEEIDVSARDERQIGKRAVDACLQQLQTQHLRIVRRGKDVAYLKSLVKKIQPMMRQQERYPKIEVYLVLSDHCDARCFPGGYLVFFRGLLESAENEATLIGMVGHELSHLRRRSAKPSAFRAFAYCRVGCSPCGRSGDSRCLTQLLPWKRQGRCGGGQV